MNLVIHSDLVCVDKITQAKIESLEQRHILHIQYTVCNRYNFQSFIAVSLFRSSQFKSGNFFGIKAKNVQLKEEFWFLIEPVGRKTTTFYKDFCQLPTPQNGQS